MTPPPTPAPRLATPADAALLARVLVDAFHDDPMWGAWAFPVHHLRRANRSAVFSIFVAGALRYPSTWIAAGDAAVAMWIPPGGKGLSAEQEAQLEADLRDRVGAAESSRILQALDLFVGLTPTEPHYYLSMLGTDPAYAGAGYGQRLLAHTLRLLDVEGAPAYLDCADNLVRLYERFGFRRTGSVVLPDGPRSNGMWRPVKSGWTP